MKLFHSSGFSTLAAAISVTVSLFAAASNAAAIEITRQSLSSTGAASDAASEHPWLSGDGRFLVFHSTATTLAPISSGGRSQIYLRDRLAGTTTLISLSPANTAANGNSINPVISANGRFVVFLSDATNIVGGDTNNTARDGNFDVFVYDTAAGNYERVSVNSAELQANGAARGTPAVSADGTHVAFESAATNLIAGDTNAAGDVFVRNRTAGTTVRASERIGGGQANGPSFSPSISANGQVVAFASDASNLSGQDANERTDIYVRDFSTGQLIRASVSSSGAAANGASTFPAISADGQSIVFQSLASNLDTNDQNSASDIFLRERAGGLTSRISRSRTGGNANGASSGAFISADGNFVAFLSNATNIISPDGNNIPGDQLLDVFLYNRSANTFERLNTTVSGSLVEGTVKSVVVDTDASVAAFATDASALVPGDTNDVADIYVTDTACTVDSDNDGVADCSDGCPFSDAQTAPTACGCAGAPADSDSDGTADCADNCPLDPAKTAPGTCGCGFSDADANGNSVADCFDPVASTIPQRPRVAGGRGRAIITLPNVFSGVSYRVLIYRRGTLFRTIDTGSRRVSVRLARGRYTVRYQIVLGGVTSRQSRGVNVRVR